jgi:hypothetical protein
LTSFTFIGYGTDVQTDASFIFMTISLAIAFVGIPGMSSKLIGLLSSKTEFERKSYTASSDVDFVVVIGYISAENLYHFFEEFFHKDHGDK